MARYDDVYAVLTERLGAGKVKKNEPMHRHLSMEVGGPAALFITPENIEELAQATQTLSENNVPFYVIGNGTNVIVKDEGYDGAIICLLDKFSYITRDGNTITAEAGAKLKDIAEAALENGLSGMEFACGIPGALGGAVCMNAGAYGGEMKDILRGVVAMDRRGEIRCFKPDELDLGYRHSVFSDGKYIVISAEIELAPGNKDEIKAKMDDLNAQRKAKQPLEYPSCGSTFKRPEGYFAGKLIMDSGLSGARVGGAGVSVKHCGFVINDGHGTACDVLELIKLIQTTVKEKQGVDLVCEVKIL